MNKYNGQQKHRLLTRLNEIGQSLELSGNALALIGLGSVGTELSRLDDFSDLDFFVITENGFKKKYIEDISWLHSVCTVSYIFRNTEDGYKLLFSDGIFCEFAVYELHEIQTASFAPGRIVWKKPEVPDSIAKPQKNYEVQKPRNTDWLIGEALTNLFVGLCRDKRGEKLSAQRFIQHYAVDRIIELAPYIETQRNFEKDFFSVERRFEQRFPHLSTLLPGFILGYEKNKESALAILNFLEDHFPVNKEMARVIRELIE